MHRKIFWNPRIVSLVVAIALALFTLSTSSYFVAADSAGSTGVLPYTGPPISLGPVSVSSVLPTSTAQTQSSPTTYSNYAEVEWFANDANYAVTSSCGGSCGGIASCVNTGVSPCFTLQLTTGQTTGGYQFVFFVSPQNSYGDIIACVTSNTNCNSGNSIAFGGYPVSNWYNYNYYVVFTSATNFYFEVCNGGTCTPYNPCTGQGACANLNNLYSWEASTGVGDGGGSCAVWQEGILWYVQGYAPSGYGLGGYSTTPATCTTSGGSQYNGGSVVWVTSSGVAAYTGEASNLNQLTWFQNSATNYYYALQV